MDVWKSFTEKTSIIPISYYSTVSMPTAIERCAIKNDWKMFIILANYDKTLYRHYNIVFDILDLPAIPTNVIDKII